MIVPNKTLDINMPEEEIYRYCRAIGRKTLHNDPARMWRRYAPYYARRVNGGDGDAQR